MKVMVFVKATTDSENAVPPTAELLNAMHQYNEALIAAGILQDQILGGLKPGDRVITSDYTGYGSVDRIDIQ